MRRLAAFFGGVSIIAPDVDFIWEEKADELLKERLKIESMRDIKLGLMMLMNEYHCDIHNSKDGNSRTCWGENHSVKVRTWCIAITMMLRLKMIPDDDKNGWGYVE